MQQRAFKTEIFRAEGTRLQIRHESCGNCRAVETVEKPKSGFPTVPTALGKRSAKSAPRFPQFPQLLRLVLFIEGEKEQKMPNVAKK